MLNIVYVGIGQCGNNFANCFAKSSTEKAKKHDVIAGSTAIAINTAAGDMSILKNIPDENKVKITLPNHLDGAGRDPEIGRESMTANLELIEKSIETVSQKSQMEHVDLCFLWAGLGGGTGSGGILTLADYLTEKGYNVALGVTMPSKSESKVARMNAYNTVCDLLDWNSKKGHRHVPILAVDNNKIENTTLERSNEVIANAIIRLNKATAYELIGSNFDNTDFMKVLQNYGMMAIAKATIPVEKMANGDNTTLLNAIKDDLNTVPFMDFTPDESRDSAFIVVVPPKFINRSNSDFTNRRILDENIAKVTAEYADSNPHQAIFVHPDENAKEIFVYFLLTGMVFPEDALNELDAEVAEYLERDREKNKKKRSVSKGRQRYTRVDDEEEDEEDDDDTPTYQRRTNQIAARTASEGVNGRYSF